MSSMAKDVNSAAIQVANIQTNTYQENESIREQAEEYFPLTSVEKKLCAISFGTGVVLLAIFLGAFWA